MRLAEILIVVALVVIVSMWSWSGLSSYSDYQLLQQATETVLSSIETARYSTLESRGGFAYGVHIASSSVTVYRGPTYDVAATSNTVSQVDPRVTLTPSFAGGGSNLLFKKLTGVTEQPGKLVLQSPSGRTQTVSISSAGAVSTY